MKAKTINAIEQDLAEPTNLSQHLSAILQQGYRPRVELLDRNGRKKRRNAAAENWSFKSGDMIRIWFETGTPAAASPEPARETSDQPAAPEVEQRTDLIQALHRAESQPGFGFVSLKWFRDAYLPRAGYSWAVSESSRQQALHDAIQEGVIVTSKVPNPRSPEFPVTAIRLNRASPETKAALGGQEAPAADFAPVKIPGESLSETVLRERR